MKIKELRLKQKKTRKEVAENLNIGMQNYINYEMGYRRPDYETLIKLADYFGTTVDYILEHNSPYVMDISLLGQPQIDLMNKIKNCSEQTCLQLDAYLDGLKSNKK